MLVLSRRVSEKIVLPELGVTLEITRIQGNKVRIGITAPDQVRIMRSERLDPNAVADPSGEKQSNCFQKLNHQQPISTSLRYINTRTDTEGAIIEVNSRTGRRNADASG